MWKYMHTTRQPEKGSGVHREIRFTINVFNNSLSSGPLKKGKKSAVLITANVFKMQ